MERNEFEGMEEVEKVESAEPKKEVELKEYEKLLIAERNRELVEKAITLVNYGCFNQTEVSNLDFNVLKKVSDKKFKGKYDLYENTQTFELVFVCPLAENNAGDGDNERKDLAAYAYDCVFIESMDEETYKMVCKAGKNNLRTTIKFMYYASLVAYCVLLALTVYITLFQMITYGDAYPDANIWYVFSGSISGFYIPSCVIALPLIVLMSIKYKKYKEQ